MPTGLPRHCLPGSHPTPFGVWCCHVGPFPEKGHWLEEAHPAHFIMGDYRSMTPSNITNLLKKTMTLQPPKECPHLLRLPLFYRVIEGLVLALLPDKFLSQQKPGRLIWTWQQTGYVATNTIGDYTRNNDRACVIPITTLPPRPTAELAVKSKETVGNSWSILKVILGHKYHHNH